MGNSKIIYAGDTLIDLTGDTVEPGKMLEGVTAHGADGEPIVGTIKEVELATPGLSMNADGSVVAYIDQPAGYTSGGYKTYRQPQDVVAAQTIMPGTEDQVIPAYHYLTGKQTIKGDPDLVPENIVKGATIFDVEGAAETGGVEPPDSLALDPDVVYATTRPKDWLPMPTPGDDEIYILCHIQDGQTSTFIANISVSGKTTVEFGTIIEGAFVAQETLTSSSGGAVKKMLDSASYGDLTSDGKKQCMVRIKGPVTVFNGASANGPHPGVEVVCGIKLTQIRFGYTAANERCWMNLRYVSFVGNGGAANLDQAFYWCTALKCIRCEADNQVTNIKSSLRECGALVSVSPKLITSTEAIDASYFAQRLSTAIFPKFAAKVSSLYYAFQYAAFDDINFDALDTSECNDMNSAFRYGYSIRSIRNLDISSLSDTTHMFTHLFNLQRLTFAGETTPGGFTISVSALGLTRPALLETINSLPVATAAATLTITGCSGASELTEDEIAIATAKNWTITI